MRIVIILQESGSKYTQTYYMKNRDSFDSLATLARVIQNNERTAMVIESKKLNKGGALAPEQRPAESITEKDSENKTVSIVRALEQKLSKLAEDEGFKLYSSNYTGVGWKGIYKGIYEVSIRVSINSDSGRKA